MGGEPGTAVCCAPGAASVATGTGASVAVHSPAGAWVAGGATTGG